MDDSTFLDALTRRDVIRGVGGTLTFGALSEVRLTNGDYVSAYLENTGGSMDLTAETFALTV